jgi:hypothetical protein
LFGGAFQLRAPVKKMMLDGRARHRPEVAARLAQRVLKKQRIFVEQPLNLARCERSRLSRGDGGRGGFPRGRL